MEAKIFGVISSFHLVKTWKRTLKKMQKRQKCEKIKWKLYVIHLVVYFFFFGKEEVIT